MLRFAATEWHYLCGIYIIVFIINCVLLFAQVSNESQIRVDDYFEKFNSP
nr:MAG TPA: FixH [Caudoviricetes sp.]